MPLIVSTAVHTLCSAAITRAVPDKIFSPVVFSNRPPDA
jgi:hypothetical protein